MNINMEITYKVSKNIIEKIEQENIITSDDIVNSGFYLDEDGIIRLKVEHGDIEKDFYCVTGNDGEGFIAFPKERCIIVETEEELDKYTFDMNFAYISKSVKGDPVYRYRQECIKRFQGEYH